MGRPARAATVNSLRERTLLAHDRSKTALNLHVVDVLGNV